MAGFGLPVLFSALSCGFAGIAVAGALAGGRGWVIAVTATALAGFMASLAFAALRKRRA